MSLQFVHSHDSPRSHEDTIWALQWTAANQVISAGADGKLILWDPANGSPVRALPQHPLALISLSTDEEGTMALCNSIEGTTTLWDLQTGDVTGTHESYSKQGQSSEPAWSVSLSPKGDTYAASNASGSAVIISAKADNFGTQLRTMPSGRTKFGLFVSYSPDGTKLALSSETGAIYLFDVESGSVSTSFATHAMAVRSLTWSPDSQLLLSASDDKRLVLHDVRSTANGKMGSGAVASFNGHASWVLGASLSSDGKAAISGSADRTIKVWDIAARACVSTIQEQGEIWGVSWRPTGNVGIGSFASTGSDGCVRFWRGAGSG